MSKICIVTATRAEYGLLKPVISGLIDKKNDVRIVVSGAHLSEKYGLTYKEIEKDGFEIDAKIDMKLNSDTPTQISNSMANAIVGFANYFQKRRPDCVVILGDRYDVRYLPPKYGKDYKAAPVAEYGAIVRELNRIGNNINQIAAKQHSHGFVDEPMLREAVASLQRMEREFTRAFAQES